MLYAVHKNISQGMALETAVTELRQFISRRIKSYFSPEEPVADDSIESDAGLDFISSVFTKEFAISLRQEEKIILMTALMPHIQPDFFESLIAEHLPNGGDFPAFGGIKASNQRSFLPTGETAQFILAGNGLEARLAIRRIFEEEHFFYRQNILWLDPVKEGEPFMGGRIIIASDLLDKILTGKEALPRFGMDFPARRLTTHMLWDDLVLNPITMVQINEISNWLRHHHLFYEDENLKRKIKPGYRVLFYGPPGTGKTLTAALLGKQFEKEVYRIDLSQIVSKYIGETEKNLENVFKKAESKDWILFFDEADALFGKRTNIQSAHDKHANQEVSYLLQRVEDYPSLMILASNFRNNLDEAFLRRFHSLVHFPFPNYGERLQLWKKCMPAGLIHDSSVKLEDLARQYELSGASILNAIQHAVLQCYTRSGDRIMQSDLLDGIRKEYLKEDKSF